MSRRRIDYPDGSWRVVDGDDGIYGNVSWPMVGPGAHRRPPWRQAAREWAEDIATAGAFAVVAVGVFAGLSWLVERLLG